MAKKYRTTWCVFTIYRDGSEDTALDAMEEELRKEGEVVKRIWVGIKRKNAIPMKEFQRQAGHSMELPAIYVQNDSTKMIPMRPRQYIGKTDALKKIIERVHTLKMDGAENNEQS